MRRQEFIPLFGDEAPNRLPDRSTSAIELTFDALEFLNGAGRVLYYPVLILVMFHGRRRDSRDLKEPNTYKFLWSKTLCHRHDEALLSIALMVLALLPMITWSIIFVSVLGTFDLLK
jgi:hypothetical protein